MCETDSFMAVLIFGYFDLIVQHSLYCNQELFFRTPQSNTKCIYDRSHKLICLLPVYCRG